MLFRSVAFGVLIVGLALVPAAALLVRARRLLKVGFEHSDLAPAFKAAIERGREERAFSVSPRPTKLERIAGVTGLVGISTSALALILVSSGSFIKGTFADVLLVLGMIGWPSALGYLALLQRRRDIDTEFWGKLWTGRVGDRKSTRLNSSHIQKSRMPSSA